MQVDVLEPTLLLLRRTPRYARPHNCRGSAGRDFDDFPDFQHYRCSPGHTVPSASCSFPAAYTMATHHAFA